MQLVNQSKYQ